MDAARELEMMDMADWFQAAIGMSIRKFGQGHYQWEAECRRVEGAEGGASYDRRYGGYSFFVKDPNRTEILHGPMHKITTTFRATSTLMMSKRDPRGLLAEAKRDAFEKHVICCAHSILNSVGADYMVEREELVWLYDDIDGYEPTLDEHGTHMPMIDPGTGQQMFTVSEQRIHQGSGLVERLGSAPFRWGVDAKWRLRYYRDSDMIRYLSNTQRPEEDCVEAKWMSQFRVEILEPQSKAHWKGWEKSLEWKDYVPPPKG